MATDHVAFPHLRRVTPVVSTTREQKAIEIAVNVATRRADHRANDEAVALEADCVVGWHDAVDRGVASHILKSRADSYCREQKTGKRALTLGDLCEAAVSGGREGKAAARAALAPLMRALEPVNVPGRACADALAEFVREHADVTQAFLAGASPCDILKELSEADLSLEAFKECILAAEKAGRS